MLRQCVHCFASFVARGKGKKKKANEETICPVCSEKIIGTSEELNEHVDQCLKQVKTIQGWVKDRFIRQRCTVHQATGRYNTKNVLLFYIFRKGKMTRRWMWRENLKSTLGPVKHGSGRHHL